MQSSRTLRKLIILLLLLFIAIVSTFFLVNNFEKNNNGESYKLDRILGNNITLAKLPLLLTSVDAHQLTYIKTADQVSYYNFYAASNEVSSWIQEIERTDATNLARLADNKSFVTIITKNLIEAKIGVEKIKAAGKSALNILPAITPTIVYNADVQKKLAAYSDESARSLQDARQANLARTGNDTRWIEGLSALMLILLLGGIYYTAKYLKQARAKEAVLKYNSSLIKNFTDAVITTDAALAIVNWNNHAQELFGFTESEAQGKQIGKLLKISYTQSVPEMMEFFIREKDWKGEAICHRKTGEEVHVQLSSSIVKHADKTKSGVIVVIRDTSSYKNLSEKLEKVGEMVEQQVRQKTHDLNIIFDRVSDAFIAVDNEYNYTYVNSRAAELVGKSAGELIGSKIQNQITNGEQSDLINAMKLASKLQQPQRLEISSNKSSEWFEAMVYPSLDGISVYFRNITNRLASQQKLQQMHGRLQSYLQTTPLAVVEMDADQKIALWNESAEKMFGWKATEVLGRNIEDLGIIHQADATHTITFGTAQKEGFSSVQKMSNVTKDKQMLICQWYHSPLKDDHGNVIGLLSLVEDVTSKDKTESELQEAETKFRNLVEKSILGVYIIQDEKLVYVNPKFAKIFGYESGELTGIINHINIVHPTDREKVAENIRARIRQDVRSINYQFKGITKQGNANYVEVFGSFTVYKGKPAIIGSILDVTQRHQFVEQLERSRQAEKLLNERFLLAAKATKDAVWDWDMVTNRVWGNETFCEFLEQPYSEEIVTEEFFTRVHRDDKTMLLSHLKEALRNKTSMIEEEFKFQKRNGTAVIIHDKAYIIYDENGRAIRVVGAFHDVTEQKLAEQKLLEEKELSDSIINSLPGIFYLINEKGVLIRWNKNFEIVTGYNSDELVNFHMKNLFPPQDLLIVSEKSKKIFAKGEDNMLCILQSKNGDVKDYQLTGNHISLDGGPCLLGVGIDVSDRIVMQKQLEGSEQKFRQLVEQASDGIFICDLEGHFLDVNTSMCVITGFSQNEMLQVNSKEIFLRTKLNEWEQIKRLSKGEFIILERKLKKKDGELCDVEVSYKLLQDGKFQGIARDITSRRLAEKALRISESKYRILFDKNPLPMFILSTASQKFLDVNAAAIDFYGYTKEEFEQKNLFDLMSNNSNPIVLNNFGVLIRNIQKGGVYHHYKKDGQQVNINTIIHEIVYDDQPAKLIVASDETEKILAEESLKKSHESLRQLATHLESVREAERTHMAREIHDELGQQLTGLKMDISWIGRKLNIEEADIKIKMHDVKALIDKTIVTVRRLATELRPSILDDLGLVSAMEWQSEEFQKRSEITSHFSVNNPTVVVGNEVATNIFRIFQESLTNVLRHSNATEVNSKLTATENELELEINDNGKGFNLASIESKRTLGLLGMKERVHIMGGSYNIFSKPGQGTKIKILVPLHYQQN